MHVDKPKDQDLVGHAITKFHLIFFFDFSQALGHPINSLALIFHGYTHKSGISAHFALFFSQGKTLLLSFSTGTHTNQDFQLTLLSFSLKERARKLS